MHFISNYIFLLLLVIFSFLCFSFFTKKVFFIIKNQKLLMALCFLNSSLVSSQYLKQKIKIYFSGKKRSIKQFKNE